MHDCFPPEFKWLPYFIIAGCIILNILSFGIGYMYGEEKTIERSRKKNVFE